MILYSALLVSSERLNGPRKRLMSDIYTETSVLVDSLSLLADQKRDEDDHLHSFEPRFREVADKPDMQPRFRDCGKRPSNFDGRFWVFECTPAATREQLRAAADQFLKSFGEAAA